MELALNNLHQGFYSYLAKHVFFTCRLYGDDYFQGQDRRGKIVFNAQRNTLYCYMKYHLRTTENNIKNRYSPKFEYLTILNLEKKENNLELSARFFNERNSKIQLELPIYSEAQMSQLNNAINE